MYLCLVSICLLDFISRGLAADLCYFNQGRSILVDDKLYFMGGVDTFEGDNASNYDTLYWLDLSTSFPVDGLIGTNSLQSTKGSSRQYVGAGAFFTDSNSSTLYTFAGYPDNTLGNFFAANSVTAYYTHNQSWSDPTPVVSGGSFSFLSRGQAMYATSQDAGLDLNFFAGGGTSFYVEGMVTFNASHTDEVQDLSWTNQTSGVPYFWGPATEFARFGDEGVLISVGGYLEDNTTLRKMSEVQVYDIASQIWFNVTASGDIPQPRSEFCSTMSPSPDDTTFQMTTYGGWSSVQKYALEDVHVLALPAFRWIKINDTGNTEATLFEHAGRRGHQCHTYRDRQMIVLGGELENPAQAFNTSACDQLYPAIKLLDTTTFEWQTQFPLANTTYAVPKQVSDVIGGGSHGGATVLAPPGNFQNSTIAEIFSKRLARYNSSNPDTSGVGKVSTVTPSNAGSTHRSSNRSGAIAGGVIGGLAAFALICATLYFCLLKRRKTQQRSAHEDQKLELSAQPSTPDWAKTRPADPMHEVYDASMGPVEVHGEDAMGEMDASNSGQVAEMGEMEDTRLRTVPTENSGPLGTLR